MGPWGLDLGIRTQWFSFNDDLNNGYYDPDYFRRFAGTALILWSPSEDDWVGLNTSFGWHRDDSFSSYEFGSDVAVEGVFGLYSDWQLTGRIAHADRLQETGRYFGTRAHLGVLSRF